MPRSGYSRLITDSIQINKVNMLQTSLLNLLCVMLVSCGAQSSNINEPIIDANGVNKISLMSVKHLASSNAAITTTTAIENNESPNPIVNIENVRSQRNQSFNIPQNVINHANDNDNGDNYDTNALRVQTFNRSYSYSADMPPLKPATTTLGTTSSGKVYNKNDLRKRKIKSTSIDPYADWKCPNISEVNRYVECSCDLPQTLRCLGDIHGLQQIAEGLRTTKYPVSLLDCTLKNVTFLSDARIFNNVSLHGLVISSGEIKRVHRHAFLGMKTSLIELGLPNNELSFVPSQSLLPLNSLNRLDLSNNRIKYLDASDFLMLQNLSYLELSDNNISEISMRAFLTLKKLQTLKLSGNRLEIGNSLQAISECVNLRELDLSSNLLRGPLVKEHLPVLKSLESLNLGTNLFRNIHTGAFEKFPFLTRLTLHHNQIDVLQDHSFSGLNLLQVLDLSYNGIIAISGASLKHLSRLLVLNLTHNFLRALTADLIAPLPSLKELRVDGNEISLVAKNAFIAANDLENLYLQNNPLSCDCSLKPFAEWLSRSSIAKQDQLSAVCATPPHLEGATLQEIPLDSLNCDGNVSRNNTSNVLQQLEIRSKQTNLTFVKQFSDGINLKKIHLSMDYGLILTWSILLNERDFSCDAIFVFRETKFNENLLQNLPVHCESNKMENENIVSVILYDTAQFTIGEKYRFCLVLLQKKDDERDLIVGCSNITKLKQIENILVTDRNGEHTTTMTPTDIQETITSSMPSNREEDEEDEVISDISSFEKISDSMQNEPRPHYDDHDPKYTTVYRIGQVPTTISTTSKPNPAPVDKAYASQLMHHFNDGLMPSISIGILVTSVFAFIWATTKLTHHRRSIPATVCYAATDQHSIDIENSNRYLKLQATTTL